MDFSLDLATWMKIHVLGRKMWMDFFFGGNPAGNILSSTALWLVCLPLLLVNASLWQIKPMDADTHTSSGQANIGETRTAELGYANGIKL